MTIYNLGYFYNEKARSLPNVNVLEIQQIATVSRNITKNNVQTFTTFVYIYVQCI